MSVKLRMTRLGCANTASYRLAATDSRNPRDGRVIEYLGHYDPTQADATKQVAFDLERIQHWLKVGAQPSDTVRSLLKKQGLKVG